MAGKQIPVFFSVILALISVALSAPPQYQTLVLTSLPQPRTEPLSWATLNHDQDSDPESTLSVDLHHVDNLSPLNQTPESLFNLRLRRDAARVKTLAAATKTNASGGFSSSVVSGLAQGSGEYFTRIGVGTPPRFSYMVLDTGSDIVWVQCSPCQNCYAQADPVFNPNKSSSFSDVLCGSPLCRSLDSSKCNNTKKCRYEVSYGDGSFTLGEFATETLTFRKTKVPGVAFGCGHDNEGLFVGAAGLLGLGRGNLSFAVQAGERFGRKFSYCLVDRTVSAKPSTLMFGDSSVSKKAVFTPLLTNPRRATFFYVGMNGISVGGTRVPGVTPSLFKFGPAGGGGVIVDSGTSVTRLTQPAYVAMREAFRAGASNLTRGPEYSLFDTCYDLSGKTEVRVPTVVMHFDGADVSLPASNYLIPVGGDGRFCFAFAGTMNGLTIIGNIQQQGFRVVYDLAGNRVGFAPRGCA